MKQTIIEFIQRTFLSQGFSTAVLGVSGGVDSATSLCLTVEALGKDAVFPLILPYGEQQHVVEDALLVIDHCHIPRQQVEIIHIQTLVDSFFCEDMDRVRKGNIMARVRMILLYDRAKKHSGLVVGTENKSEHYLGYFTRFGDEASDLEPLRHLYKTQVYQLASECTIPSRIIKKPPSANLWEGQTDEQEFGFGYERADHILRMFIDEHKTRADIVATGIEEMIVDAVLSRVQQNNFKHNLPYLL